MRVWYLISVLLFIDSILVLINEKYELTYNLENNWKQSISYSGCEKLTDIFKNEKEIRLNQLNESITNYFKNSYEIERKELFLEKLRSKDYYINRELICIIRYYNKNDYNHNDYYKYFYRMYTKVFVFNNETLDFLELNDSKPFNQIIINNLAFPFSNCKYNQLNRFKCVNDCNKQNNKLSKYYYHGNEINSNQIIKIKFNDKEIKANETKCIESCKKYDNDCKLIYFKKDNNLKSNTIIFQAYPSISKFDFWIQFVGLICFFTNLCLYYLFTKLIKIFEKRIKIKIKIIQIKNYKIRINSNKCLNYLKNCILFIWFLFLSYLIYQLINEYLNRRDQPIKKEITTTELQLKLLQLLICFNLKFIYNNYRTKTLFQLENETSKSNLFENNFKDIYLEYQNIKIKINYKLNKSKVLFYEDKRCYQLEINPQEYKYQNKLLITKLIVEFKDDYRKITNFDFNYYIYLLYENENFTNQTYNINFSNLFLKKEIKRSKLNKINKCKMDNNKWDLINRCMIKKFIFNNQNISRHLVIDKDQFTNDKWTKLSFNYSHKNYNPIYRKYLDECNSNYSNQLNCDEIEYRHGCRISQPIDNKLRLELYHDVIKEIEEEPSIYKLLMNILNIQSILFGLNIFNSITILFNYDKIKFKYNKLLIYLLCLIGFSYHLWFIFNEIINGELIYSQHYKLEKKFNVPNLVLCIEYNQNLINPNYKLTYKYLDKITNQININKLIYEINYLNKSSEWSRLNNFGVDTFYFLNKKCFEIKFNLEYELDQFLQVYKNDAINIKTNYSFLKTNIVSFLFRVSDTNQFGKIINLSYGYEISIELMEIDYDDKFSLIKNPLSLIYGQNDLNNADKYLNNLINNFKNNFNLATLNLPLNKDSAYLSIEDQLFDQLYLQIQNFTDYNRPSNLNFKRSFIDYNLKTTNSKKMEINLIFFKKIIKITNEDNYTKLIVNLLNLLSLWFDLGLFDVHIYLDLIVIKINFILIFLHKLLIKIKCKLFLNI